MSPDGHSALMWFIIGIVVLIIHFLPSYIAFSRHHASRIAILIINIFLGWTGIVWIVLLIWALN